MEVVKEYNYNINGRNVVIKRHYAVKGNRAKKICELEEYFKNNYERVRDIKKLRDVYESYNNEHEDKISFSMLYQKYISVFGRRKKQTIKTDNNAVNKTDNNSENTESSR